MTDALTQFQDALLARRVAQRVMAFEHDSEEARKKYLKDHPGASPSKHTVKKQDAPAAKKKDEGGSKPKLTGDPKTYAKAEKRLKKVYTLEPKFQTALKSLDRTTQYKFRGDRKQTAQKALDKLDGLRKQYLEDSASGMRDVAAVIVTLHKSDHDRDVADQQMLMKSLKKSEDAYKDLRDFEPKGTGDGSSKTLHTNAMLDHSDYKRRIEKLHTTYTHTMGVLRMLTRAE